MPDLEIPVWFIAGRNDYNTPSELVKDYVEVLNSPSEKELIIMEGTAHTSFFGDPAQFNRFITQIKHEVITNKNAKTSDH